VTIIDPWNAPIDIKEMQYAIKGNMIKAQLIVSDLEQVQMNPATFQDDRIHKDASPQPWPYIFPSTDVCRT